MKKLLTIAAFAAVMSMLATFVTSANAGTKCQKDSDGNVYCCHSDGFGCN